MTSHKDICTYALWSSATIVFKKLRATHPNSLGKFNTNQFFTHRLEWPEATPNGVKNLGCKNQAIEKLRGPSHFLGPIFVNPKHPFPATKRAFEVNKGRTDVSTSRYGRIVKFEKVFVAGVEVFVCICDIAQGPLYLCPLVEHHNRFFKKLRATHPNSLENTNRVFFHAPFGVHHGRTAGPDPPPPGLASLISLYLTTPYKATNPRQLVYI